MKGASSTVTPPMSHGKKGLEDLCVVCEMSGDLGRETGKVYVTESTVELIWDTSTTEFYLWSSDI